MSREIALDFGRSRTVVEFPDEVQVILLEPRRDPPLPDAANAIRMALRAPIASRPLQERARGKKRAVVVVSDITRPIPYRTVLPPLLEELHRAGLSHEQIEILVATGLHRSNTEKELEEMLGREVVSRYLVRNHKARELSEHEYLGVTSRGTPIWIDRGFLEADLRILTGLIEPHLMAGYSGGRKALCPGLAAVETLRHAHGPAMLEDHVGPGILEGNPFHEDLIEIVERVGVDFLCDVTIDRARRVTGVFAGDAVAAHLAGCREVERQVHVPIPDPVDVVVTSAGGYPLDQTFYQSVKALVAAMNIVRRGGTIVLLAEMAEGLGSREFGRLLAEAPSPREFMNLIQRPDFFRIDQWMVQHLCQALRKAHVIVVTPQRRPALGRGFAVDWVKQWPQALARVLERHGRESRWAVLPQGPYTLATVNGVKWPLGGVGTATRS